MLQFLSSVKLPGRSALPAGVPGCLPAWQHTSRAEEGEVKQAELVISSAGEATPPKSI